MKRKLPLKPLYFGICAITIFLFAACILDPVDVDGDKDPPASGPASVNVNVTFNIKDEADVLTPNFTSVSQTTLLLEPYTIAITNVPSTVSSIQWRYNGRIVSNTDTLQINVNSGIIDDYDYLIVGNHIFMVEITTGGKTYSAHFILTVTSTP